MPTSQTQNRNLGKVRGPANQPPALDTNISTCCRRPIDPCPCHAFHYPLSPLASHCPRLYLSRKQGHPKTNTAEQRQMRRFIPHGCSRRPSVIARQRTEQRFRVYWLLFMFFLIQTQRSGRPRSCLMLLSHIIFPRGRACLFCRSALRLLSISILSILLFQGRSPAVFVGRLEDIKDG